MDTLLDEDPLDESVTSLLGRGNLPSARRVFTPPAFDSSMDVIRRAQLAKRGLEQTLGYAKMESDIRDQLVRRQAQDLAAIETQNRMELEELQPFVRADLEEIDPFDEDALERLSSLESFLTRPQDLRRARNMRMQATMYSRERDDLFDAAAGRGWDEPKLVEFISRADEQFRSGDPDAFRKAKATLPSINDVTARAAAERRAAEKAESALEDVEDTKTKISEELIAAGLTPRDTEDSVLKRVPEATLPPAERAKFKEDPLGYVANIVSTDNRRDRLSLAAKQLIALRKVKPVMSQIARKQLAGPSPSSNNAPVGSGPATPQPSPTVARLLELGRKLQQEKKP